jgi:hypothetical protein
MSPLVLLLLVSVLSASAQCIGIVIKLNASCSLGYRVITHDSGVVQGGDIIEHQALVHLCSKGNHSIYLEKNDEDICGSVEWSLVKENSGEVIFSNREKFEVSMHVTFQLNNSEGFSLMEFGSDFHHFQPSPSPQCQDSLGLSFSVPRVNEECDMAYKLVHRSSSEVNIGLFKEKIDGILKEGNLSDVLGEEFRLCPGEYAFILE